MVYYVMNGVYVLVCLLLLLVVLLQQGKGGDIASAFGGGGSQTAFGARGSATVLSRASAVFGALFMLGALALAIVGQQGPGSVLSGVPGAPVDEIEEPAATTAAPATEPLATESSEPAAAEPSDAGDSETPEPAATPPDQPD